MTVPTLRPANFQTLGEAARSVAAKPSQAKTNKIDKMKNIGIIILTCLNFLSCAQTSSNNEQQSKEVKDIKNLKTDKHLNIPYTHVFIDIHDGYTIPKNQTQIFKDNFTGINIMEIDGGNFYTNAAQVTKPNLEKQGFIIDKFIEFQMNGNPAILYLATSPDNMNKSYQLVTGDSTFSVILMGYTRPDDPKSLKEIKEMMLSFVYDKKHHINYEEIAPFNYEKNASKFGLASATSTFYTFTYGGIKKEEANDDPFIMVMTFPSQGLTPKSLSLKMKNQVQSQGIALTLKEDSFEKVNGFRAYEALYTGKQGSQDLELYTLTIMNDEYAVVIQGRSNNDFQKNALEIKKFAHSIMIK